MDTLNLLLDTMLARLAWTSAQAVVLIGAVWLIGRLLPQLSAALRCTLWWLVGLQLILGLCWSTPLQLRVLPATTPHTVALIPPTLPTATVTHMTPANPTETGAPLVPSRSMPSLHVHWQLIVASLWLAALLVQLIIASRQWRSARRVLRDSQPLRDDALRAVCAEQMRELGLRQRPVLRVSAAIQSPQVAGLWRTTVLLPADQRLTLAESAMAMAHELAHLRRGDLWLGWVPAVAQRLFFFHPLVAWAVREYALTREAACDAQVLERTGTMPQAYGHLLLRLGVAHPMHSGLAGASPSFQNLKRRLTMLQQTDTMPRRARGWPLIILIVLAGVLPYRVTASAPRTTATTYAPAGTMPMPPPPVPPPPPAPPVPPAPPPPPPHSMSSFSAHHVNIDTSANSAFGFALLDKDSVTINGSDADVDAVKQLRKANEPLLWFRRGKQPYVVRDRAYIQRAKAIYAPVTELGKQQGALGGEQGRLGGLQGGLGARQGALGMRQGQVAAEQAKLAVERAALAIQPEDGRRRAGFEAGQARLQASEDELARQQDELGRQQDQLGRQQDVLGAKQDALGKLQQEASLRASEQIRKLLDEAIAKGAAKPASAR